MDKEQKARHSHLREELISKGPPALSDAELLAVFLGAPPKGMDPVEHADTAIQQFDGLRGLLAADAETFCSAPGLGAARYAQLKAALEMAARYFEPMLQRDGTLTSPEAAADYARARLGHYPHEVFACVFLDSRNRIVQYEELFHGTIAGGAMKPREFVRRALAHNSAAVIPAHNRPAGTLEVGDIDRQLSLALKDALAAVEIRLVDYIVVGGGDAVSLAARGWL